VNVYTRLQGIYADSREMKNAQK